MGKWPKLFHVIFYFCTVWDFAENEGFGCMFVIFLITYTVSISVMSHVIMITSFSLTGIFWIKLGFGCRAIV